MAHCKAFMQVVNFHKGCLQELWESNPWSWTDLCLHLMIRGRGMYDDVRASILDIRVSTRGFVFMNYAGQTIVHQEARGTCPLSKEAWFPAFQAAPKVGMWLLSLLGTCFSSNFFLFGFLLFLKRGWCLRANL